MGCTTSVPGVKVGGSVAACWGSSAGAVVGVTTGAVAAGVIVGGLAVGLAVLVGLAVDVGATVLVGLAVDVGNAANVEPMEAIAWADWSLVTGGGAGGAQLAIPTVHKHRTATMRRGAKQRRHRAGIASVDVYSDCMGGEEPLYGCTLWSF